MNALAAALLAELDDDALAALAERLAPYLPQPTPTEDGWLDSRQAAEYLAISRDALKRHMAARRIPFTQDTPGGRAYFRRADLDRWRQR